MFNKNQLAGLMKKAQEMQESMKKAQEEIANLEATGESGAGLVKVLLTGKHDVKKVSIDPSLMDDKDMLEDLIAAAINDANRKIEEQSKGKLGAFGGLGGLDGLNLPF